MGYKNAIGCVRFIGRIDCVEDIQVVKVSSGYLGSARYDIGP